MYSSGNAPQRIYEESFAQKAPLGSIYIAEDGRIFRYALAGGTALVAGALVQSNTTYTTSHVSARATSAPRIGSQAQKGTSAIGCTTTTTSLAANALKEGYFSQVTAGAGFCDQISGHPAVTAGTAADFTVKSPFPASISVGTLRATVYPNLYDGVIVAAAAPSKPVLGIPQFDVSANAYFWLLVRGISICRRQGTPVEAEPLMPSASTAGALTPWVISVTGTTAAISGDPEPGGVAVTGTATITQYPVAITLTHNGTQTAGNLCLLNLA